MTTLKHQIDARCQPERIWDLLADLEAVQHYNPTVRSAAIDGTPRSGVGARRVCELVPKGRVVERVTHWEERRALGLEVVESDWPIHFMRWVTRVEPHGTGARITQDLEYRVKHGPIGWLLDRLVMKRKLRATLDDVFARLVARGGVVIRDFESVVAELGGRRGVAKGRMFGSEGLKVGTRVFAMEVKGALVVKLDTERASALCKKGLAVPFDPGHGRLMKQWVAIGAKARADWVELATEALAFARRAT